MRKPIGHHVVRALPRRALTQLAGQLSSAPVPRLARGPIYRGYARAVGADLDECGEPLDSFPSFNRFFARPLKDGARPIAREGLVSPADGRLDACGVVTDGALVQAKGIEYSLADLVADETLAAALDGATYATVYLSPADYHRVHAPTRSVVRSVRYIPGELWPVNGLSVPYIDGLFRRNERVVFELKTEHGPAALVMVGATVVGAIEVAHSQIGRVPRAAKNRRWNPTWTVERGDELGAFLLGSTVILVVPGVRLDERWGAQSRVLLGDTLLVPS